MGDITEISLQSAQRINITAMQVHFGVFQTFKLRNKENYLWTTLKERDVSVDPGAKVALTWA